MGAGEGGVDLLGELLEEGFDLLGALAFDGFRTREDFDGEHGLAVLFDLLHQAVAQGGALVEGLLDAFR